MEPSAPELTRSRPRDQGILASFRAAGRGIAALLVTQRQARIHLVATVSVGLAGWFWGLDRMGWSLVVIACTLVWTAEGMNTALEGLSDVVQPEWDARIGRVKDIAAGAVLCAALGAVALGVLAFWPHGTLP